MGRTIAWIMVLGVFLTLVWQPQVEAAIVINEVLADPAGDANADGSVHATRDEFVELVNTDPASVSLAHWTLSDSIQLRHAFGDTAVIPERGFFVIFGGGAPQGFANVAVASSGGLGLNNTGDTLTLRNAQASVIDSFMYGPEGGRDVSLTRSPDATGAFVAHADVTNLPFSPGKTFDGLSALPPLNQPEPIASTEPGLPEPPEPDTLHLTEPDVQERHPSPVVPEPASIVLLGAGLLGLGGITRHQRKPLI